jgi:osmotically-inducible protein OsmY
MRHASITVGIALLLSGALATACSNAPDPQDQVSRELEAAQIEDVNLDYDSSNRVLHLKGEVDNTAEKSRAEEIATRVVGTSGHVANELTIAGPASSAIDDMDGNIRRELNAKIANDAALENRSINFDVNNGVVTIKGEVRTDAERQKVAELTRATANVRDVVNSLTLDGEQRPAGTSGSSVPGPNSPR